jgi:hypothetical protein
LYAIEVRGAVAMKRCATCRHAKQVGCMDLVVLFRCGRNGRTVAEGDSCVDWEAREPRRTNGHGGRPGQTGRDMER